MSLNQKFTFSHQTSLIPTATKNIPHSDSLNAMFDLSDDLFSNSTHSEVGIEDYFTLGNLTQEGAIIITGCRQSCIFLGMITTVVSYSFEPCSSTNTTKYTEQYYKDGSINHLNFHLCNCWKTAPIQEQFLSCSYQLVPL